MKKLKYWFSIVIIVVFFLKFFIGIYQHDEFSEHHIFFKHRPIWKSYFWSPIGMSDKNLDALPQNLYREELYFNEFIRDQGLSR